MIGSEWLIFPSYCNPVYVKVQVSRLTAFLWVLEGTCAQSMPRKVIDSMYVNLALQKELIVAQCPDCLSSCYDHILTMH